MTNLHEVPALQKVRVDEDIILSPLAESDKADFLDILDRDPKIRERVQFANFIRNEIDFKNEVEAYKEDSTVIRYAIRNNTNCIGMVSFWRLGEFSGSNYPDTYGFGYFLDPTERGKGIAPNVLKSLMHVAMNSLVVDKFIAFCEDDNESSQKVLKKAGFAATDEVVHFEDTGWIERKYEAIIS